MDPPGNRLVNRERLLDNVRWLFLPPPKATDRNYFFLLDAARGVAALTVILWHYKGFFNHIGATETWPGFTNADLPLYAVLVPLYQFGDAAVQLFWMISGFIFSSVYLGTRVSAAKFFRARFARLYPLHALTLIVIAVLQMFAFYAVGGFVTFVANTPINFFWNAAFMVGWFQTDASFNAPIWSVCVEVWAYAMFWALLGPYKRWGGLALLGAFSMAFFLYAAMPFGRAIWYCATCFFIGTLLYLAYAKLAHWPKARLYGSLGMIAAGPVLYLVHPAMDLKFAAIASMPGVILSLSSFENRLAVPKLDWAQWLGECSYGIYLWHIPMQILLILVLDVDFGSRALVYSPYFLIFYVAITVMLARTSFERFERPLRLALRKKRAVLARNEAMAYAE